jgi:hypothetical protein
MTTRQLAGETRFTLICAVLDDDFMQVSPDSDDRKR